VLKPVVVGASVNKLGVSQLVDVPEALIDLRVDEGFCDGAQLDALVDLVVGFHLVLVVGEFSQDEVIARRLEGLLGLRLGLCQETPANLAVVAAGL